MAKHLRVKLGAVAIVAALAMLPALPAMADYPPTPNDQTPTAPAPAPLDLGALVVYENGVPVVVTTEATSTTVTLSGNGWSITLSPVSNGGQPLALTADGHIIIPQSGGLSLEIAGFKSATMVALYLYSNPIFLGELKIDSQGRLDGVIPMPADAPTGDHTLQIVGSAAGGTKRVIDIGVFVRPRMLSATASRFSFANLRPLPAAKLKADRVARFSAQLLRVADGRQLTPANVQSLAKCAATVKVALKTGKVLLKRGCLVIRSGGHTSFSWKVPAAARGAARVTFTLVDKGRATAQHTVPVTLVR